MRHRHGKGGEIDKLNSQLHSYQRKLYAKEVTLLPSSAKMKEISTPATDVDDFANFFLNFKAGWERL